MRYIAPLPCQHCCLTLPLFRVSAMCGQTRSFTPPYAAPYPAVMPLRCVICLLQHRCDDYGKGNLDQEGSATAVFYTRPLSDVCRCRYRCVLLEAPLQSYLRASPHRSLRRAEIWVGHSGACSCKTGSYGRLQAIATSCKVHAFVL